MRTNAEQLRRRNRRQPALVQMSYILEQSRESAKIEEYRIGARATELLEEASQESREGAIHWKRCL